MSTNGHSSSQPTDVHQRFHRSNNIIKNNTNRDMISRGHKFSLA